MCTMVAVLCCVVLYSSLEGVSLCCALVIIPWRVCVHHGSVWVHVFPHWQEDAKQSNSSPANGGEGLPTRHSSGMCAL